MQEQILMLKVSVVKGKKLAVRDFKSSDPYVVVKVANQTAKTKVIRSCLNPVWNEELTFAVTEPVATLELKVFDKDMFKSDKMGHAHLSLHPIISASRLKQAIHVSSGKTLLRKVVPNTDNCLVGESSIICIDNEVVQNVCLRLMGVECGEIELRITLIGSPFPHSP